MATATLTLTDNPDGTFEVSANFGERIEKDSLAHVFIGNFIKYIDDAANANAQGESDIYVPKIILPD